MRYISVCSGIEAATVAFHPLGFTPIAFSEIDPFPCKVLAHHYPEVPNLGDMTKFKEWPDYEPELLVGGTPCQSFSIAGLRKGLDDPRGNLMLTYLAIAAKYRPKWILWENVPRVLSTNGGRDFASFLAGLEQCGYGFAYKVLDAQYCRTDGYPHAVPQRRRRVFVVGCLGDWRSAAAVLFDSEGLRGNPPPSRETGKEVAGTFTSRTKSGGWGTDVDLASSGYMRTVPEVAKCLTVGQSIRYDSETETMLPCAVAFGVGEKPDVWHCLRSGASKADKHESTTYILQMQVRRLMPVECARLQGFPDDYLSQVPSASDTQMYRALGNSMAVNVMNLIGRRIQMANNIK